MTRYLWFRHRQASGAKDADVKRTEEVWDDGDRRSGGVEVGGRGRRGEVERRANDSGSKSICCCLWVYLAMLSGWPSRMLILVL